VALFKGAVRAREALGIEKQGGIHSFDRTRNTRRTRIIAEKEIGWAIWSPMGKDVNDIEDCRLWYG
jgi:hypothetical protein